jgi:hypothetical protein
MILFLQSNTMKKLNRVFFIDTALVILFLILLLMNNRMFKTFAPDCAKSLMDADIHGLRSIAKSMFLFFAFLFVINILYYSKAGEYLFSYILLIISTVLVFTLLMHYYCAKLSNVINISVLKNTVIKRTILIEVIFLIMLFFYKRNRGKYSK